MPAFNIFTVLVCVLGVLPMAKATDSLRMLHIVSIIIIFAVVLWIKEWVSEIHTEYKGAIHKILCHANLTNFQEHPILI